MVRKFCGFVAVLLICVCMTGGRAAHAEGEISLMKYFYKSSDLATVPSIISDVERSGLLERKSGTSPVIGFLAALFVQHPDKVDGWLSGYYQSKTEQVIAVALTFAGQRSKAIRYVRAHGWNEKFVEHLRSLPDNLLTMPVQSGADLDVMWSASFATGDPIYVERILDMIKGHVNSGVFDVEDIISSTKFMRNRKNKEGLRKLVDKYGEERFMQLVYTASALWASGSNAFQHPFVKRTVEARINIAPQSDLSYALKRAVFWREESLVANEEGADISLMVFMTSDSEAVKAEADSGQIESISQRAKNVFTDDDDISVIVLTYVKSIPKDDTFFDLETPSGNKLKLFQIKTEGTGIFLDVMPITADMRDGAGFYKINVAFPGESGEQKTFVKRFVISRR